MPNEPEPEPKEVRYRTVRWGEHPSHAADIKTANEKFNLTWQAVSAGLYGAAFDKASAGHAPAEGQSGTQPEAGGPAEGGRKDEGPIIDAEVVDEKKAA